MAFRRKLSLVVVCALIALFLPLRWPSTVHAYLPEGQTTPSGFRGFDTCATGSAPSVSQMQAFWTNTPYWDFYVYLGRYGACPSGPGPTWVNQVTAIGYNLVPIWWDLQPPCLGGGISTNTTTATQQGEAAADAASSAAISNGFGSGTIVALDIEGFDHSQQSCAWAVNSFVNGFDWELRNQAMNPIVYSNPSDMVDWPNIPNVPYAVWFADWNGHDNVWNESPIGNGSWSFDQRYHQYLGQQYQYYNGVHMLVDVNCANALVGGTTGNGDSDTSESNDPVEDPGCN